MYPVRRCFSYVFYISCLILAAACFYFSITESLFSWLIPDELVLSKTYNSLGFWGCTKMYYFSTTINRVSADFSACLLAKNAALFSSPFRGWVLSRLMVYILIPISLAYFLQNVLKIIFKQGIIAALLISAITILIITNNANYLYGLDLAIYGTATISFFIMSALFIKCFEHQRYFKWFCLVFAINLTSHEVFLVISGFFIPMFAWYIYSMNHNKVKYILLNKSLWILLLIYLISFLVTILAPGMAMRQHTWPSSGNPIDSTIHALLSLEEVFYFMIKNYILVALIFILGVFYKLFTPNRDIEKRFYFFYVYVWLVPCLYVLIVGFLMGLTPSLWGGESRTENFRIIEPVLSHWAINKAILTQGGFEVRQNWFLYINLYLNFFLSGFFLAHLINRKSRLFYITPFLAASFIFLLHPDGLGSIQILSTMFHSKNNKIIDPFNKPELKTENNLVSYIFPNFITPISLSNHVFPTHSISHHASSINNIIADRQLNQSSDKHKLPIILDYIYDPKVPNSIVVRQKPWMDAIYSLYKIFPAENCITVNGKPNKNSYCYHTFTAASASKLLEHTKVSNPTPIYFSGTQNMEAKIPIDGCIEVADRPTKGEHFIVSNTLTLMKGLNYFIFETKPTESQLYLYILGEKRNLFLPWLNSFSTSGAWGLFDKNTTLEPIFSQIESLPNVEKLKVIIYSSMPQQVHLRWQHGFKDNTYFKGFKRDASSICKAEYGYIMGRL